jgi:hypothetical protein
MTIQPKPDTFHIPADQLTREQFGMEEAYLGAAWRELPKDVVSGNQTADWISARWQELEVVKTKRLNASQKPVLTKEDLMAAPDARIMITSEVLKRIGKAEFPMIFAGPEQNKVPYQVSFIIGRHGDGKLFQYDFLASKNEAKVLHAILLAGKLDDHVQDLQVYPPTGGDAESSARGTVDDVLSELGVGDWNQSIDPDRIKLLQDTAAEIDAGGTTTSSEPWVLEFVWCNGGGDDNAFAQGFMGPCDTTGLEKKFLEHLELCVSGYVREVHITRDNKLPAGGTAEAFGAVVEHLMSVGKLEVVAGLLQALVKLMTKAV